MNQDEWKKLGLALLRGGKIDSLKLNGKTYTFDYSREDFISTALRNGWDEEFANKCADDYLKMKEAGDFQGKFIADFQHDFCLEAGGFGSGKTLALDIKLLLTVMCFPGNVVLLGRKTMSDLTRATLPDLFNLIPSSWYEYRVKDGLINFNNGSQIILFGLDAMQSGGVADIKKAQQKLKSLNLGAYFIDQLEEVEYEVIEVLNSRLRRRYDDEVEESARKFGAVLRQGNSTCNPANFWAYHVYKLKEKWDGDAWVPDKDTRAKTYTSSMLFNPNLTWDYIRKQMGMGEDYVRRFVKGEWTTDILLKGTVFAKEHIRALEAMRKPPIEKKEECLIYEKPNNQEFYQIGVDPSEGIVDPSAVVVVSSSGRVVATYTGYSTIPELADKVKFLYYQYNKAKIIPEVNKSSLLEHIKDLNVYRRTQFEIKTRRETEKLGFMTSWSSKQALISHFQQLLREGYVKCPEPKISEEMKTFVYSDEATMQGAGASRGFHDDFIIATMLAFWELTPKKVEQFMVNQSQPPRKRRFEYK